MDTALASFNGTDGQHPEASLIVDVHGNLFGTTPSGGASNMGTVYEITDSSFVTFAGTPGKPNCHGQSVSALVQQYGGLAAAADTLGYSSAAVLQNAIAEYCAA